MKKLWEKNKGHLDKFIETFETKDDLLLDQKLLPFDVQGSIAHAKMLHRMKILNTAELNQLELGLNEILALHENNKFALNFGDEDMSKMTVRS